MLIINAINKQNCYITFGTVGVCFGFRPLLKYNRRNAVVAHDGNDVDVDDEACTIVACAVVVIVADDIDDEIVDVVL